MIRYVGMGFWAIFKFPSTLNELFVWSIRIYKRLWSRWKNKKKAPILRNLRSKWVFKWVISRRYFGIKYAPIFHKRAAANLPGSVVGSRHWIGMTTPSSRFLLSDRCVKFPNCIKKLLFGCERRLHDVEWLFAVSVISADVTTQGEFESKLEQPFTIINQRGFP